MQERIPVLGHGAAPDAPSLQALRRLLACPDAELRVRSERRPPAQLLLGEAVAFTPPLAVLVARRAGGAAAGFAPEEIETVARDAPVPLLVWGAPTSAAGDALRRILVPLDGSEHAAGALHAATDLARRTRARVVLLHVEAPFGTLPGPEPARGTSHVDAMRERLALYRRQLLRVGVESDVRIQVGGAAEEVLRAAADEPADLVALTAYGTGGPAAPCGSVASALLRRCPPPLLVLGPRAVALPAVETHVISATR